MIVKLLYIDFTCNAKIGHTINTNDRALVKLVMV